MFVVVFHRHKSLSRNPMLTKRFPALQSATQDINGIYEPKRRPAHNGFINTLDKPQNNGMNVENIRSMFPQSLRCQSIPCQGIVNFS